MIVLLVLLSLLVLCTPFLLSARNADKASVQIADRGSARIGLDAVARHARLGLGQSYPSIDLDTTPYFDSLDETRVAMEFDPDFLDPRDPSGPMWAVEVQDVAGMIDLNSASPHVIANILGLSTRFAQVVAPDAKALALAGASALAPAGFLSAEGEIIRYSGLKGTLIAEFLRGVGGPSPKGDWNGGPMPASAHGAGAPVIDQRAFAPCLWRLASDSGELRTYEALEELPQCGVYALAAALEGRVGADFAPDLVRPLVQQGTVHAGARGGPAWQRAARLVSKIQSSQDGKIRVDNGRWFNPGATVRIRDGQTTELALVQNVIGNGEIALDRILKNDYEAFGAVVDVLVRRPVNVNTARVEVLVALLENLQVAGKNSRITHDEATDLAQIIVESRPFVGLEDFLRRIVLPAAGIEKLPGDAPVHPVKLQAGQGFIDPWDAVALYRNALDANDAGLAYSTMPFSFTTRDTYASQIRVTVNAESGVERVSLVREEIALIAPQSELTRVWVRQEDFDEELRLTNDAAWWMTGPEATSHWDSGAVPPSRLWAHLGTAEGQLYLPGVTDPAAFKDRESPPNPEHVFASREDHSWIQLMPTREHDETKLRQKRVLHFDNDVDSKTKTLEGRYLQTRNVARSTNDELVRWTAPAAALMRAPSLSMWIKPKSLTPGTFLDVGGGSADVDRITLSIDGPDLVLRVIDGTGDHRDTSEKEFGEVRYAFARTNSPGLPADVWSHVEIDVRGDRPSQMHMLVNGLSHGVRTLGLTRLSSSLAPGSTVIPVESTEGFPATCVVSVGNELIEVRNTGMSLDATRQETGPLAGFGGHLARVQTTTLSEVDPMVPINLNAITTNHPSGAPVERYGYSLPVASFVPTGRAQLGGDLGRFRVSMLRGVIGGSQTLGDSIDMITPFGSFHLGYGIKGQSAVTGLVLACADDGLNPQNPTPAADFMSAFQRDGGYAVLIQGPSTRNNTNVVDTSNTAIGGMEVIRYSGWQGTTLTIAERGIGVAQLPNLATIPVGLQGRIGGPRSFVAMWQPQLPWLATADQYSRLVERQTFVVPISLGVPGTGDVNGFLAARAGQSRFAQITHVSDAENTEWVRYDWFDSRNGQLVRDDPEALQRLFDLLTKMRSASIPNNPGQPGGGTPGGGAGPGGAGPTGPGAPAAAFLALEPEPSLTLSPALEPEPSAAQQPTSSALWDQRIGKLENTPAVAPISRAAETNFQFRGVFGTFSHKHPNATRILPVFMTFLKDFQGGRPGRMDAAFLVGANPDHRGWPVRVHRAHVPSPTVENLTWTQTPGTMNVVSAKPRPNDPLGQVVVQPAYLTQRCWVALQDRSPEIMQPGTAIQSSQQSILDSRLWTRLVCFPSGERPRVVSKMAIGGGAAGVPGVVPSATVDEIVFGDAQFGRGMPDVSPEDVDGAALVLITAIDVDAGTLNVEPRTLRVALGDYATPEHKFLSDMQQDGGLLRIGDEILAYKTLDAANGEIKLAANGRGLLGTRPGAHEIRSPVMYLEARRATVLNGGVSPTQSRLTVANIDNFPREGTVLIGRELIHYTRLRESSLEMPRASSMPGKMDQKGAGIFRGRYGTTPAAHAAGEAVILFPTRYYDRWAKGADAPELAYFGLSIEQPAAFWNSCFFSKEDTAYARIGVLQKSKPEAPWDADPDVDKRVVLTYDSQSEGNELAIGRQSDQIAWRVFVEYMPGAFDVVTGLAHGWRETPRLKLFGAKYHAPSMVLSSVER